MITSENEQPTKVPSTTGTRIILVAFLMTLLSCSNETDLRSDLIGEWSNVSLEVTVHSYLNSDSTVVLTVSEAEWEQTLQIKPIRTTFLADGTYMSEYRGLDDSLLQVSTGTWEVIADSLILTDETTRYSFQVTVQDTLGRFSGMLDWDGDGQTDDEYVGVQRHVQHHHDGTSQ